MGGQRGLIAIVLGIVVLVGATVAIVLVAGNRAPRTYDVGSPEAALQAYLVAWEAGDYPGAYAAFSRPVRDATSLEDYRRQALDFRTANTAPNGPTRRVFIDSAKVAGELATLQLTIEETWVNGLNASRNRYGRALTMVREDGAWRLDQILMGIEPWWANK